MVIITVANQKGGVAKTTTAVSVAHGLSLRGYNVLLVDLDPQGQCASYLNMQPEPAVFELLIGTKTLPQSVRPTARDRLWLIPGDKRTASAQVLLVADGFNKAHLLGIFRNGYVDSTKLHFIVLDTAPSVGGIQEMALYAAHLIIIPAAVDYLALDGVTQIIRSIQNLQRPFPPVTRLLPTFFDETTRVSQMNLNALRQRFPTAVMPPIHRAAVLREAPAAGKTIFEYDPNSRAAREYAQVIQEVLDVIAARRASQSA